VKDDDQNSSVMAIVGWTAGLVLGEGLKLIVEHGVADLSLRDAEGKTPLAYARDAGAEDLVEYLKDQGATE
jgi:hypothetical protein